MRYLLYNPLSGTANQACGEATRYASEAKMPTETVDVTQLQSVAGFFQGLEVEDDVVLFGGDGSLNRLVNGLGDMPLQNDLYYYPCGSGNDFARDVGQADAEEPFLINEYLKDLPTVTVNGKQSKFINGVGYGLDGYCCGVGDDLKRKQKPVNYTSIAIKALLFSFKPANATVIVDGREECFKKVWIAPTMFGRYYGGGMMTTPAQNRNGAEKSVSLMVFHDTGNLQTLMIFPSIFKGTHVKKKKYVTVLEGKEVTVKFDRPTALQIDGETVQDITEYTVTA